MEEILWYWGPFFVVFILVVAAFARQAKYFRAQVHNYAAQAAELSKIHQSLERIAAALEARGRS